MKCDKCGSPNVVTKIVIQGDKNSEELNLCPNCFQTFVKDHPEIRQGAMGQSLNDFLLGTLNLLSSGLRLKNSPGEKQKQEIKKCPVCSTSSDRVVKEGIVGCDECYIFFKEEVKKNIFMNTGTDIDILCEDNRTSEQRITELGKKLEMSVKTENFELAASVRDEINKLKKHSQKQPLKTEGKV